MGKGTDKLYITHSEWASEDAYSASYGAGVNSSKAIGANFRRLPFNFCALSLQPFEHPVCTTAGTIFDLTNILPWLKKHGTNPVDGQPLRSADLIKLNFAKNDDGEYVDPVTYKVFTNNTHLVALRNTGNVFSWDTVERLNIKAKNWRDLVSDEEFSRKDIITLQDPQNLEARDLSAFKYIKDGECNLTEEQEKERASGVNADALGSSAKVLRAKEAVAKARADRDKAAKSKANGGMAAALARARADQSDGSTALHQNKPLPYNAAQYTTGKAAASFTSTGVTPHTSNERALLSEEEYMLKPRRVKIPGYARIQTSLGELNVELHTEFAPKAVWNFVQLAKKGYYRNISFHRNIRNFMIQGGDPTGTGRGGSSVWGKNFNDEFEGPNKHDARGILSMANKGKNTNSSQFFITYRAAKHLDLKHTIFGRVVGGMDTLSRLENAPTDSKDRPDPPVILEDVVVFVDPFEEFQKQKAEKDAKEREQEEIKKAGGTEDDKTTWTGKRIRGDGTVESGSSAGGVGKYLQAALAEQRGNAAEEDEIVGEWDEPEEPVKKKFKAGGFGNFDSW
ncbi:Peptidyl-prolyl cis-trans isomerase cyclophilin-type [Macrophomina phaseolina MS6]|uniref:Peptidyl-prolyl cis-trans isomerase-like 2 n=1 Tax=Macrophomina phaseolina (strain MS6) TaxID=1126212 RepID=K2S6X3_MACPH|nr:Peptidyl-prolyl cis-trans isomerase cyclophilin-type [Macrophomina phaseolina MS6]